MKTTIHKTYEDCWSIGLDKRHDKKLRVIASRAGSCLQHIFGFDAQLMVA